MTPKVLRRHIFSLRRVRRRLREEGRDARHVTSELRRLFWVTRLYRRNPLGIF